MTDKSASSRQTSRRITTTFATHGLNLSSTAASKLLEILEGRSEKEVSSWLDTLVTKLKEKGLRSSIVGEDEIEEVARSVLDRKQAAPVKESIIVLGAFDTPHFRFDSTRRAFVRAAKEDEKKFDTLHATATEKADALRSRFTELLQRVQRSEGFCPPTTSIGRAARSKDYQEITLVKSLLGAKGTRIVFGMLTQQVEGQCCLEDLSSTVPLDLKEAGLPEGLFTDSCIVIAEGELVDGVFCVKYMAHPPSEERTRTLKAFPTLECFGLPFDNVEKALMAKELVEKKDEFIVMLSDMHLDNPKVLQKLGALFTGLRECRPPLFVFMGDFTQKQYEYGSGKLKGFFDELCALILQHRELMESSRFVFVPGPSDGGGMAGVWPRHPLPAVFTERLRERLRTHAVFTTNPCRILFRTHEIVLFRDNLNQKLRRNCLIPPADSSKANDTEQLVVSIIDQSHLCPLPQAVRPTYWNYEHALRFYPTPNALVLADTTDQYRHEFNGCQCFNPGSFSADFSFVSYYPATRTVQNSRVP